MKYFCPLPWIHQAIRANGDVRICCHANQGPQQGILETKVDNLTEARNDPLVKDIRKAILNNEWHPECVRCQHEMKSGLDARPIYESSNWEHVLTKEQAVKITKPDGSIDTEYPVSYYDLRFGNLCNLKCRMCGPTDSNAWYNDYVSLNGNTFTDTHGKVELVLDGNRYQPKDDVYNWYTNPTFWENIESNISDIKQIYFAGGEPFLIDRHYDFLQLCIDKGYASNISIEYNTNLTNIPERAWNIWKYFKEIKIGVSLDGIGPVTEYIRYPSKWSAIEKNLHKLDIAEGNFKIWLSATVQIYNILHLPDMMAWKQQQGFKRINFSQKNPLITTHPLHAPSFFNIQALPKEIKTQVQYILEQSIKDFEGNEVTYNGFVKQVEGYIKYMNNFDMSNHFDAFISQTKRLDNIRKQSFKDSCPEIYNLIKDYYEDN